MKNEFFGNISEAFLRVSLKSEKQKCLASNFTFGIDDIRNFVSVEVNPPERLDYSNRIQPFAAGSRSEICTIVLWN